MDIMKIESKFMRNVISKIMSKLLKNKFKRDVKFQLNEFEATGKEGDTHIHLSLDIDLSREELSNIIKEIL